MFLVEAGDALEEDGGVEVVGEFGAVVLGAAAGGTVLVALHVEGCIKNINIKYF